MANIIAKGSFLIKDILKKDQKTTIIKRTGNMEKCWCLADQEKGDFYENHGNFGQDEDSVKEKVVLRCKNNGKIVIIKSPSKSSYPRNIDNKDQPTGNGDDTEPSQMPHTEVHHYIHCTTEKNNEDIRDIELDNSDNRTTVKNIRTLAENYENIRRIGKNKRGDNVWDNTDNNNETNLSEEYSKGNRENIKRYNRDNIVENTEEMNSREENNIDHNIENIKNKRVLSLVHPADNSNRKLIFKDISGNNGQ